MGMRLENDDSLDHVGHRRGLHRLVRRSNPLRLKLSSMRDLIDETSLLRVC
jgi:hypothetical protein